MFSLATVILSACSPAISSRTGATILHGPHHSAQKSTMTGLSLVSTSSANELSVTVTVFLPAMFSPFVLCLLVHGAVAAADQFGRDLCVLLAVLGQPALGVDRGGTA